MNTKESEYINAVIFQIKQRSAIAIQEIDKTKAALDQVLLDSWDADEIMITKKGLKKLKQAKIDLEAQVIDMLDKLNNLA